MTIKERNTLLGLFREAVAAHNEAAESRRRLELRLGKAIDLDFCKWSSQVDPEHLDALVLSELGIEGKAEPCVAEKALRLLSPWGVPINGYFDRLTAVAEINQEVELTGTGDIEVSFVGNTEVFWDEQETQKLAGEKLVVDVEGCIWPESSLIALKSEEEIDERIQAFDREQGVLEGWFLSDSGIQWDHEQPGTFRSDLEAYEFVFHNALLGSLYHLEAIRLHNALLYL